ncbi:hypothetical protein [Amycolatopsis sp. CA-126428]|uniref:hypothetical protein n=1 Tax=Amycolatopsis sp. CA-126428 TaxID=2073158 RepID=UPI000CD301BB|nr:hypothetical protein [Amycolatopsis sp. CA-126428]
MDDVVDALGRMKNDDLVQSLFKHYGLKHCPAADLGTRKGYENPQEGIELTVDDGIVTSVHLHSAGHDGHEEFRGPLPRGITFGDTRSTARARFGKPSSSGEPKQHRMGKTSAWDNWRFPEYTLHLSYKRSSGSVEHVTLMPADCEPGKTTPPKALMWWELTEVPPEQVAFIEVGTRATHVWYVEHTRHGRRSFSSKEAAWAAIRKLMDRSPGGRWDPVPKPADVVGATHPGPHHPRAVVDAAVLAYQAEYQNRRLDGTNRSDCCHRFGLTRGRQAAQRDRAEGAGPEPRTAEFTKTAKVRHPSFHDPAVVVEGVADGYRAGWGDAQPLSLSAPNCCYAFGFWEAVSAGEEDFIQAEARRIHRKSPSVPLEETLRKLRWAAYRRKHPADR